MNRAGRLCAALVVSGCADSASMTTDSGAATDGDTDVGTGTDGTDSDTDGPSPEDCAPVALAVRDEPGARVFEPVALASEVPGLADQPTDAGKVVRSLSGFDGRLHLGYGDYSSNTGPIAMHAFDPATGLFVDLGLLATEQVYGFAQDGANLFTGAIDDVRHEGVGGVFRLGCGAASWLDGTDIDGAVHVYDASVHNDLLWAGTGSVEGAPARLMSSDDRGQTWVEEFRLESAADHFTRFYYTGGNSEVVYVSGRVEPSPTQSFGWARTTGDFAPVVGVPASGFTVPVVFGEQMVVGHFNGNPGTATHLGTYLLADGALEVADVFPVENALVAWHVVAGVAGDPDLLWVLLGQTDGSSVLFRTPDMMDAPSWEEITVLPALAGGDSYSAMAPLLNRVYVGTVQGALHVLDEVDLPVG